MITANEARKKAESVKNNCVTREMEIIESEIEEAVRKGDYSIALSGTINPYTAEHLRELGYKVYTGSQYNESYFKIKW